MLFSYMNHTIVLSDVIPKVSLRFLMKVKFLHPLISNTCSQIPYLMHIGPDPVQTEMCIIMCKHTE